MKKAKRIELDLRKTVTVAPDEVDLWYGRDTVEVHMFICRYANPEEVVVAVLSIDDFAMFYRFPIEYWNEERTVEFVKKYVYDRIPEGVTMDWLFEHSFRNE